MTSPFSCGPNPCAWKCRPSDIPAPCSLCLSGTTPKRYYAQVTWRNAGIPICTNCPDMPAVVELTQTEGNPCTWEFVGDFFCSGPGVSYPWKLDLQITDMGSTIRRQAAFTTTEPGSGGHFWRLDTVPIPGPDHVIDCGDVTLPYLTQFGTLFCLPQNADLVLTTTDPSGSVGAMRNPDCLPQFRRGKPLIPKGKRKG